MKNKHMIRTLTVLLTVMLCMTAFSTVAFASGGDTAPTSEAQTEPTDSTDITGDDLSELISTLFGSVLGGLFLPYTDREIKKYITNLVLWGQAVVYQMTQALH